jgi:hypothetical protein
VSIEGVHERVASLERAIGPCLGADVAKETPLLREALAARLNVIDRELERVSDGATGELGARSAGGFEDALIAGREPVDLNIDELPDVIGLVRPDVRLGCDELPGAVDSPDHLTALEVVEECDHEQRVAACGFVNGAREARKAVLWPPNAHVRPNGFGREKPQSQCRGVPMRAELSDDFAESVRSRELRKTTRPDDEEACRLLATPQHREELGRGIVGPLEIVEGEYQGHLGAQDLEGVGELPEHARSRRPLNTKLEPCELVICRDARHLCEPRRSMASENLDDAGTAWAAADRTEGPKDRKVSLTAPVLLDAGPACDERTAGRRLPEQRLDERRLPDTRIPGHKHHLAPTLESRLQVGPQDPELVASNHQRRRRVAPGIRSRGAHRLLVELADVREEAVPATRDRLDQRVVAQSQPHGSNMGAKQALAHRDLAPDGFDELLLRHESPGVHRQVLQDREGLPSKLDLRPIPP